MAACPGASSPILRRRTVANVLLRAAEKIGVEHAHGMSLDDLCRRIASTGLMPSSMGSLGGFFNCGARRCRSTRSQAASSFTARCASGQPHGEVRGGGNHVSYHHCDLSQWLKIKPWLQLVHLAHPQPMASI
jgi:hypothetical protein